MKEVRTRFAPSPTGFLHVGGIRTALFAYLVAKQAGGKFILRIEDTDKSREVEGSKAHLIASLKALGLNYDEGPDIGGDFGPYTQSARLDIYHRYAKQLVDRGLAYADPYTPQEIQAFRDKAKHDKKAFVYRDYRPTSPPTWDGSQPLRLKTTAKSFTYHDEVMGDITTSPEVVDDFILIKSDGYPTYNFAHIIDDTEMNISHVIRGQEFISSMPNFLTLYEALELTRPVFAHLPHVLNAEGNKKLSKRDGAKDVLEYINDGYLPEALNSFMATLGWNDGSEQEVWTMAELIEKFSLSRVQKSGARFDEKRLLWMNGHFIRQLSIDNLSDLADHFWPQSASSHTSEYKRRVLSLAQDRLKTLKDLPVLTNFFFEEPTPNMELISSNKQLSRLSQEQINQLLAMVSAELSAVSEWTAANIQDSLNKLLEKTQQKPAVLFGLIRIVTTWAPFSPQLPDTLELLGRDTTLSRLSPL
ncbi:glutamate--tRNA ligase [Candidatus Saccharibacteria bacterium]|nr:glutamate--tRNA ligase [Candidatus Saccharibacteria bacterium]